MDALSYVFLLCKGEVLRPFGAQHLLPGDKVSETDDLGAPLGVVQPNKTVLWPDGTESKLESTDD